MRAFLMISMMFMALTSVSALAGTNEKFKLITAGDLAQELGQQGEKNAKLAVFDVNTKETRKKDGVIPGAKLLPSTQYETAKELPADKNTKLVFYCANPKCMAS